MDTGNHFNAVCTKKPEAAALRAEMGVLATVFRLPHRPQTTSFRPFYCAMSVVQQSRADQWNCSSSVEPVRAFTLEEPPWITVVTSSK